MTDKIPNPSNNKIPYNKNSIHRAALLIGCIFFLLSIPIFNVIPKELKQGNYNILYLLIFPLIAYLMLSGGWKLRKKQNALGQTPLMLSPAIGQVGGDIGGTISLIKSYKDEDVIITISCIHHYSTLSERRSTSEKNWYVEHNDIFWAESQKATYTQDENSLKFCFEVPDDLPTSENFQGEGEIHWMIEAEGQLDEQRISRNWSIPVEMGIEKSIITVDLNNQPALVIDKEVDTKEDIEADIKKQIIINEQPNELYLISQPGRNLRAALIMFLFGAVFAGFTAMLYSWAATEGGILWHCAFFISPFPLAIWGMTAFLLIRKLESKIIEDKVYIRRSIWGHTLYTLEGKLTSIGQISIGAMPSSLSTIPSDPVDIIATLNIQGMNKNVALAEGIQGEEAATQLQQLIIKTIIKNNKSLAGELEAL